MIYKLYTIEQNTIQKKFIIDREGNVVARFEPTADMKDVEACVKALL